MGAAGGGAAGPAGEVAAFREAVSRRAEGVWSDSVLSGARSEGVFAGWPAAAPRSGLSGAGPSALLLSLRPRAPCASPAPSVYFPQQGCLMCLFPGVEARVWPGCGGLRSRSLPVPSLSVRVGVGRPVGQCWPSHRFTELRGFPGQGGRPEQPVLQGERPGGELSAEHPEGMVLWGDRARCIRSPCSP